MRPLALLGLAAALLVAPSRPAAAATLVAAGDIASCRSRGDERTELLLRRFRGTIAALGDTVYELGSYAEYLRCYGPTWGRHRARTRPAIGNHEYRTRSARGYFRYFGRVAGPRATGWYGYRLGGWQVVVLNTNCTVVRCGPRSQQYRWLDATLRRARSRCVVAYGHHPRFSSSAEGGDGRLRPFWRLFTAHGVDLYLAGHHHHYERFDPRDAAGRTDWRRGTRQFIVGTGGRSLHPVFFAPPSSRARSDRTYGVLVLRLLAGRYTWRFVPVRGGGFSDFGAARCR